MDITLEQLLHTLEFHDVQEAIILATERERERESTNNGYSVKHTRLVTKIPQRLADAFRLSVKEAIPKPLKVKAAFEIAVKAWLSAEYRPLDLQNELLSGKTFTFQVRIDTETHRHLNVAVARYGIDKKDAVAQLLLDYVS